MSCVHVTHVSGTMLETRGPCLRRRPFHLIVAPLMDYFNRRIEGSLPSFTKPIIILRPLLWIILLYTRYIKILNNSHSPQSVKFFKYGVFEEYSIISFFFSKKITKFSSKILCNYTNVILIFFRYDQHF